MSNAKQTFKTAGTLIGVVVLMASCGGDTQSPGVEYMPDMYRSPSIEAYVDYGQDPYWFSNELAVEQRMRPSARKPVAGTIVFAKDTSKAVYTLPYAYPNTLEGYEAAGIGLHSPIAMTEFTVAQGKAIYEVMCIQCHGEKGMGDGAVITKGGHPPPLAYNGPLKDLPEGKMFHTVTYGKGAMGSHASQLNKEERWTVIQYVKYLQAGGKMPSSSPVTVSDTVIAAVAN